MIINLKNEFKFFLIVFCTNSFSIWNVVLFLTDLFKFNEIVFCFRESLWVDQAMWVFFVPMIYQIAFKFFLYDKINPELKKTFSNKKILFVYFAIAIINSSFVIEYAYFAGETMLIIPKDNEKMRGENYENIEWIENLGRIFLVLFLVLERYRHYLIRKNEVIVARDERFNSEVQISLIIIGFSLALSVFVAVPWFLEQNKSDNFSMCIDRQHEIHNLK